MQIARPRAQRASLRSKQGRNPPVEGALFQTRRRCLVEGERKRAYKGAGGACKGGHPPVQVFRLRLRKWGLQLQEKTMAFGFAYGYWGEKEEE